MSVRKGDTVLVTGGKEKGRTGRIDRILADENRVVIEGVNMVIRHVRPRPDVRQAGRVQKEAPIHISNVALICNKCNKPTRPRIKVLDDGKKVRECRSCNEAID